MVKIIQALQELERHWAVTKSYPSMPPGANTINPAVIEGGRHLLLSLTNVAYGLPCIICLTKVTPPL